MDKFTLLKAHVDQYVRKDGTVVQAHDDKRAAAGIKLVAAGNHSQGEGFRMHGGVVAHHDRVGPGGQHGIATSKNEDGSHSHYMTTDGGNTWGPIGKTAAGGDAKAAHDKKVGLLKEMHGESDGGGSGKPPAGKPAAAAPSPNLPGAVQHAVNAITPAGAHEWKHADGKSSISVGPHRSLDALDALGDNGWKQTGSDSMSHPDGHRAVVKDGALTIHHAKKPAPAAPKANGPAPKALPDDHDFHAMLGSMGDGDEHRFQNTVFHAEKMSVHRKGDRFHFKSGFPHPAGGYTHAQAAQSLTNMHTGKFGGRHERLAHIGSTKADVEDDPDLDDPAYNTRVKLPKYNGAVTATGATNDRDAANILIRNNPRWSKENHARLAEQHKRAADRHDKAWNSKVDEAAKSAWGRPFKPTDYKISGIASDEFSDAHKAALRTHAHAKTAHTKLAAAHLAASKSRAIK